MSKVKYLAVAAIISAVFVVLPGLASAQSGRDSVADLQDQIQNLLAQVQALQAQLAQVQGNQGQAWCHTFNTNLGVGVSGDDVDALQTVLQREGISVSRDEYTGNANFGESTASAVSAFQEKYRSEILTPAGLSSPTGYVGARTRVKLNALYGCGVATIANPASVYCVKNRGKSVITTNSDGSQGGMCVFPDGSQCDEWAYYYGTCKPGTGNATTTPITCPQYTSPAPGWCSVGTIVPGGIDANGCQGHPACISTATTKPYISSVSPSSGPVGTTVIVIGANLSGFEGDKDLWIENSAGQKGITGGASDSTDNMIKFTLAGSYCTANTSYSGLSCPSYITITPGTYNIYAMPFGTVSNKVQFTVTSSTQPSITVLSPNRGEQWAMGSTQTIKWSDPYVGHSVNVNLDLLGSDGTARTLVHNIADNGTYAWLIPYCNVSNTCSSNFQVPADTYRVVIAYTADSVPGAQQKYYSTPFSIVAGVATQPSITVVSPNGGETYQVGQQVKVQWKTKGISINPQTQVDIVDDRIFGWSARSFFGSSPALDYARLVSTNGDENTYEYTFTVPENFNTSLPSQYQNVYGGNHYKMNVIVLVGGIAGTASQQIKSDLSDAPFTIAAAGATQSSLVVALDPSTPVSRNLSVGAASVEVARVRFAATSGGGISITRIDVQRMEKYGGCYLGNIKLFDVASGAQVGATVPALDTNCVAIFDNLNFVLPAGVIETLAIKVDIPSFAKIGDVFTFGVIGAVAAGANGMSGIPVWGNPMTVVLVSATSTVGVGIAPSEQVQMGNVLNSLQSVLQQISDYLLR